MKRKCTNCKNEKEFTEFHKSCERLYGISYVCKDCMSVLGKNRNKAITEKVRKLRPEIKFGYKMCFMCATVKRLSEFNRNKARSNGVYSMCTKCRLSRVSYPKSSDFKILYNIKHLEVERWADIIINNEKYPYKISDCGRVLIISKNRIANPSFDQVGYPQIVLTLNKKRVGRRIHILVGIHFLKNTKNLKEFNHLDGNKLNPHYTNLAYCTSKENKEHAFKTGLWKPFDSYSSPKSKRVQDLVTGEIYPSASFAQKKLGINGLASKLNGRRVNDTNLIYL